MSERKDKRERTVPSAQSSSTGTPGDWPRRSLIVGLAFVAFGVSYAVTYYLNRGERSPAAPPGMVFIPGGEFVMGTASATAHRNEQPAHRVRLDGFFIDETEVTNAQFLAFVNSTGYVSTAEKAPDWESMKKQLPPNTPKPPTEKLVPGSLVFRPPSGPVPPNAVERWWEWVPGACWKHPEGPGSDLTGRENHPVVQVSWFDAIAYAAWAGKRLSTEAEWEFACRGGLAGKKYPWGDNDLAETDGTKANIWQGEFPYHNTKVDGWERTAPVRTYPPNGYGLYEMGGNVWEWCADWYRADAYFARTGVTANPQGPAEPWDPDEPLALKRVIRGGSFLCHPRTCLSYRTAARRGGEVETGMSHIGFRCVISAPHVVNPQ